MRAMDVRHARSAERVRRSIEQGRHDPARFRAALRDVPAGARDTWLDLALGLGPPPDDGPELPRGGVPYLPCSVDALLGIVDEIPVRTTDVFVDVGSGVGRATALVHLLTGAAVIGIEIQPRLVQSARELVSRLADARIANIEGDAAILTGYIMIGSVFFLYCPFSGERLRRVLDDLEAIAQTRPICVCCVDLPLPPCPWLVLEKRVLEPRDVTIYRSCAVQPNRTL
jgi:SAM-dependent methyltransferase